MDRTSWKPKIYKATEAVDYKAEEEGTSDGAKKGWLTRQRGGGSADKTDYSDKKDVYFKNDDGTVEKKSMSLDEFEKVKDDYKASGWSEAGSRPSDLQKEYEKQKESTTFDWAGQVGATKSEADQDKASDLMDKYYELVNEPMMDLPEDGSAMEERKAIHAKGVADFKAYLESSGSATVNQDVRDILEDENYHSLNKMLTKEEPETQSSRDKEFYDESTQNTLDTLNQSKVNGFPFFSYVGQPEKIISDGKGGIILYGMKRNPNSIRRIDVKYDEGRDTYTVSFMSNRNKPKGEYNDVYFDQLGGLIAGNKGLGVESYATEDDYKYDWDQLTSLAQKALSDIGYDKESWDSEPEDIRKEMEKVAYSEENWKDVANKFYKEELNKDKKNGGEAMYGYGSATGRMSPVEAWNQGADVYGDMGYDQSLRNPIFTDFRGLKWNELPTDIQEAWKSELGYYTQGEGLVDNIEKQLNRFGVNLDRDPEQVEEVKAKANEEGVNDWWDRVTTDGGDLDMQFRGTHFNELPLHQQNHYFNLYMEELGNDKYGNHMALYDTRPDSYSSSDLWKDDPSLGNKDQYYTGWKINEPTVDSFDRLEISGLNGSTRDNDMMGFLVKTTESKANEDVGDSWYTRIVKCDQCDGQGSLDDYDRPAWSAGMRGTTKCSSCDGTGEKEETQNITDPYGDLHYMNESKVKRYKVGDDYYDDLDDAKRMSDVTGYAVFDNDNWGKMVYDGESYSNEADPCWKGYKQIGMKDKNGKQVPNCVPNASESVLEKVHVNGWEFSVIDDGYGGGWADTANTGTYEVGIFAPDDGNPNGQKSAIKGWLTQEEVDDLKRTFEVDPVMAYRRIGGEWEEDWQEGGESKANEVLDHAIQEILRYAELNEPIASLHPTKLGALEDAVMLGLVEKDGGIMKITNGGRQAQNDQVVSDSFFGGTNRSDIIGSTESKASEAEDDWVDKYFEFTEWIEDGEIIGYLRKCKLCGMKFESFKIGEQREHLINNHGFTLNELEGNISSYEGFNQGLYGYVDAKCKTCGIEFDSIPDMDDHYAMNPDHVSNLNDLDSDIPNSD